jgi:hypothetical protein
MPETPFSAPTDDLAIETIKSLIKLDKAHSVSAVKQSDGTWLIKADIPPKD